MALYTITKVINLLLIVNNLNQSSEHKTINKLKFVPTVTSFKHSKESTRKKIVLCMVNYARGSAQRANNMPHVAN